MTDIHSKKVRSYNMSRIRGKNTKPEMIVRKFLHRKGYRYGLHNKNLPGSPDLVMRKHKTVIFVNGCFWHGHKGCKYFVIPKTRTEFWSDKIEKNRSNDIKNYELLKKKGWRVLIIWECDLKERKVEKTLNTIINSLEKKQLPV